MLGLEDLRKVLLSERETARINQIPHDLFDRTHAAISSLLEKVYAIEDPLSDEARALIEETMSIRETAHELFVIRAKKILTLAGSQAQGNYIDRDETKKMIPAEREMFDRIASAIGASQGALLSNLRQSFPPGDEPEPDVAPEPAPSPGGHPGPVPASPSISPPYALVRVLDDMDAFMGVDGRIYALGKGDIVTLPERNAEVLVERNIALNMNLSK
jgi:DNA replication factor GINS